MDIKFRPLTADEIEVKVKQVKPSGVCLLLYKTARTDMNILDDCVGAENWENDYKVVKDNLYAGIGIRYPEIDETVWKWDCGIESREDDEGNQKKGEASDAFKRAGFKWGIGRALYTAPFIWIKPEKLSQGFDGKRCFDKFEVERIAYSPDGKAITGLAIRNTSTSKRVFVWQAEQ